MECRRVVLIVLMLMISFLTGPGTLQADDWIKQGEERFVLAGGVFLSAFDTNVRIDNATLGKGTSINLEDDLGFDEDVTSIWGGGYWRFAKKHRIGLAYFGFNRDASAIAKTQISIGDEIFPVGAGLSSEMKLDVIPLTYSYSFLKREKYEFAGTAGIHWASIDFKVLGSVSLGGLDANAEASAKAGAPLPLLGLSFDYHFTPRWSAGLHGSAFYLDLDDDTFSFAGSLLNFRLSTEYWLFNNFGLGAAMNWFQLSVDVKDDDWEGALKYQYFGPQVYIMARF